MNEDNGVQAQEANLPQRIFGFAPGDRVAIVDCEYSGAYGKVVHVRRGCAFIPGSTCASRCYLIVVDLMSKPTDTQDDDYYREAATWAPYLGLKRQDLTNARRFIVSEVIHVD